MDDEFDDLTADTTFDGEIAIIRADGEIDLATRDAITSAAHGAVADGATRLVLDLSAVTFMDSSGIAALIDTLSIASVTLRKPSEAVDRLIATTGLTDTFCIEP